MSLTIKSQTATHTNISVSEISIVLYKNDFETDEGTLIG